MFIYKLKKINYILMDETNSLKNEVLEGRLIVDPKVILSKVRSVVGDFKRYPHIIPSEGITLYNYSDPRVMEQFRQGLLRELETEGYKIPIISRDSPSGYSIDIDHFLGVAKENGHRS